MTEAKIHAVKGSRTSTRSKKRGDRMDRVRFVPRGDGGIDLFLIETGYAIGLLMPVETTIPAEAWEYERIGGA